MDYREINNLLAKCIREKNNPKVKRIVQSPIMIQIDIKVDGDKVTINQSATPTKVEKNYFIVMCNYNESSWPELVTENYSEAIKTLHTLEGCFRDNYSYRILVQNKNGKIIPCNGADWDIDK